MYISALLTGFELNMHINKHVKYCKYYLKLTTALTGKHG